MQHISDQMLHVMYWILRLEPGEKPSEEGQPSCGGQHSAGANTILFQHRKAEDD